MARHGTWLLCGLLAGSAGCGPKSSFVEPGTDGSTWTDSGAGTAGLSGSGQSAGTDTTGADDTTGGPSTVTTSGDGSDGTSSGGNVCDHDPGDGTGFETTGAPDTDADCHDGTNLSFFAPGGGSTRAFLPRPEGGFIAVLNQGDGDAAIWLGPCGEVEQRLETADPYQSRYGGALDGADGVAILSIQESWGSGSDVAVVTRADAQATVLWSVELPQWNYDPRLLAAPGGELIYLSAHHVEKLDGTGNPLWTHDILTEGSLPWSVAGVYPGGDILVFTRVPGKAVWATRLDPDGVEMWSEISDLAFPYDLTMVDDGTAIAVAPGGIAALDAQGKLLWATEEPSDVSVFAGAWDPTTQRVYVAGENATNGAILSLDPSGAIDWTWNVDTLAGVGDVNALPDGGFVALDFFNLTYVLGHPGECP